ncbi:MAG: diadenylate cyclase CdaA [Bacteroidales bacterium]|nr:diadenylate cyclase CdaA [Bacteroidales bacterium]
MILGVLGFLRLSFIDVLDIVVVAMILYVVFRWLRGSSAIYIFTAILLLILVRVLAVALNMKLLSTLMDTIIDVGAIALIVIFQPEIRQFLSRIGRSTWLSRNEKNFFNRILGRETAALGKESVKEICEACKQMAESKTGALIVLLRKDDLQDIVDNGDRLDADIKERLIENIFFKNSPLHDGAMIIGSNRIIAARCTLPITERGDLPARYGMRHKSAVGISERSDADVIVVSEQRGEISFVRDGAIRPIANIAELAACITSKQESGTDNRQL